MQQREIFLRGHGVRDVVSHLTEYIERGWKVASTTPVAHEAGQFTVRVVLVRPPTASSLAV